MNSWGWLIIIYLFLGGLGAGAYLVAYLVDRDFLSKDLISLKKAGYFIAAPSIMLGSVLLYFDLGIAFTDPLAVLKMFLNITSVMTWGIYILSIFLIIGIVSIYYIYKGKDVPLLLSSLGAIFALGTACYTGVLLMVVESMPFWNNAVVPPLFVISAMSTGLSASIMCSKLLDKKSINKNDKVEAIHLTLIIFEILLIFSLLVTSFSNSNISASISAEKILFGDLSLFFWLFCIGCGLFLPLMHYFSSLTLIKLNYLYTDFFVLVGGFSLRAIVVFAAIPIWIIN